MRSALSLVVLVGLSVAGCTPARTPDPPEGIPQRRALVLSLDGLPWELAEKRMAAGQMPHLAALVARGAHATGGSLSSFPAKTAPAHATLWTGTWPDRHGVLGNETPALPRSSSSLLDVRPGFDAEALRTEPIWRSAARRGLSVTVLQATHADPAHSEDRSWETLNIFSGYRTLVNSSLITGATFAVDGKPFLVERDGDGLVVRNGPVQARVRMGEVAAIDHPDVSGVFYLVPGRIDAEGWVLLRSSFGPVAAPSQALAAAFRSHVGGFAYNSSRTEPPLVDGTAWKRDLYLASIRLNAEQVGKAVEWALRTREDDLTIAYLPQPDESLHLLLGRMLLWNDAEATRVIDEVLAICDDLVGRIVAAAGPGMGIAVISDHGMAVADKVFYPNLALERAGLLARDAQGRIDLARTQVLFSRSGDCLVVNTLDRQGGIVPTEERLAWLGNAERALLREAEAELGPGALLPPVRPPGAHDGPRVSGEGDSWISAAIVDGRMAAFLRPDLPPKNSNPVQPIPAIGMHAGDPHAACIRATFVFAGPGIRHRGVAGMRQIDFAPTISAWLGIDAPADSEGRVITEILEDP